RAEVVDEQPRDALGEALDQAEALGREQRADALDRDAVVDRVLHAAAREHRVAGQRDLEVELDRLRRDLLVPVQADPRLELQLANEYGVHGRIAGILER